MNVTFITQTFNGRAEWQGAPGAYFKLLTAAAACQVELYRQGVRVLLIPNAKAGFYCRASFDAVVITNAGSQLVEWIAAPDQAGSDAFTANANITSPLASDGRATQGLAVVRFADLITDNNGAFLGRGSQAGAAANNAHVQLKNPAASGKTVYVDSATYEGNGTAQFVDFAFFDTDLTTDIGAGSSKTDGGAAGVAHVRAQNNATLLGATSLTQAGAVANAAYKWTFDPPLKLAQGRGVVMRAGTQNLTLAGGFEWREY